MKKIAYLLLLALCLVRGTAAQALDKNILISTPHTSLMLSGNYGDMLRFSHYGHHISEAEVGAIHDTWAGMNRAAYPAFGEESNALTSLQAVHGDGNPTTYLILKEVNTVKTADGALTTVKLTDKVYPFEVLLCYQTHDSSDVIETWTEITSHEKKTVVLRRMDSGFLPVRSGNVWLTHLHGTWTAESQVTSEPLTQGVKTISNMDGSRNGQGDSPEVMFSLDGKPRENQGRTIAAVLCWSGNYKLRIDTSIKYCHNLMAGISDESTEYYLEPGKTFVTPRLALTYSEEGTGGASRNLHRWAREGAIHGGNKTRDILLNSWEGVYLNIDEPKMQEMMRDFSALGGELFVMDDGWFGNKFARDNDNAGLGDWVVNPRKLPHGLEGLLQTAKDNHLKFGIWIEPESANTLSELYDKHPDWVLKVSGRDLRLTRGGTQLLLDLSNPHVQDFVVGVVDNLMQKYPELAYIKWDANTSMMNYGSPYLPKSKQMEVNIDYHKGLEKILQRIRAKYPDLVMQACGGGGGRVNYGVMPYFDELWVSDNTDALQRIYIQWGTSLFYPPMAMAQHVSASPNHQTGRSLPLKFRFDVAMSGRLGMELQPSAMTDGERSFAKKAIDTYKGFRDIVQLGDQYRLISPYDRKGVASLMYVSPGKDRAVFFMYKTEHMRDEATPRFYMAGLDPGRTYEIKEVNLTDGEQPCHLHGKRVTGGLLMNIGMELSLDKEYASHVLELRAVD